MSRWRVMFWLDDQRPDELALGQAVLELKKKRQWASTVRDALKLILSLRKGDTSVLKELFPLVVDQIEYEMIVHEREESGGDDNDRRDNDLLLEEFRRMLDERDKKIIPLFDNQGGLVMAGQKPSGISTTLGGMRGFSARRDDDDDDIEIKELSPEEKAKRNMENMRNSFASIGLNF